MIDFGITDAERAALLRTLDSDHAMRVVVSILNRDEEPRATFTAPATAVSGGQVDINAVRDEDVTRSASVTLVDPERRLRVDPGSPADLAVGPAEFLSIARGAFVEELGRWIDVPLFWGPLTDVERAGEEVTLSGEGKEILGLEPATIWNGKNYPAGTTKADVVRDLLRRQGEWRFGQWGGGEKLNKKLETVRGEEPWRIAKKLSQATDRQLFYDGLGRAHLRPWPAGPSFEFVVGRNVTRRPRVRWGILSDLRNVAHVLGEKPAPDKPRPNATAMPAPEHPLSPQSLARRGEPRFLVIREENSALDHQPETEARARRLLEQNLDNYLEVEFEALPNPMLEEREICRLRDGDLAVEFALRQASIPLTASGNMSVGFHQNFWRAGRIRIRGRGGKSKGGRHGSGGKDRGK